MTLGELVEKLGGRLVQGSHETELAGVAESGRADGQQLVFAETAAQVDAAMASKAGAVVLKAGTGYSDVNSESPRSARCIVEAEHPRLWFAQAARLLTGECPLSGIHPAATIGVGVKLGVGAWVGAGAVLEDGVHIGAGSRVEAGAVIGKDVRIGANCCIYPRCTIYPGATLGDRVVVHAGAILGAAGFGYVRDETTGAYTQFPQQGTLVIEDDVEVGANSTIDRGALGETRIRRGTKIDNLVHIGHNCQIGEDVIIVALTGISGSSTVGNGAVIAGQVGIGDHAHVGAGVILGGQAGVLSGKTLTNEGQRAGTVFWGTPARPLQQVLRELATLGRLTARRRAKPAASEE